MRHALEFDYSDTFPVPILVDARPGDDLRDLCVCVVDGFNAAARISIGTASDPESLLEESDVRLSVAGDYARPETWIAPRGTSTTLYLFLNPGAATSGIFRIYFSTGGLPEKGGPSP